MTADHPLGPSCTADPASPQFDEEWQRRAFGLAVALAEFGYYRWEDFQRELVAAVAAWEQAPEDERGPWSYYDRWLEALDRVLVESGAVAQGELDAVRSGDGPLSA